MLKFYTKLYIDHIKNMSLNNIDLLELLLKSDVIMNLERQVLSVNFFFCVCVDGGVHLL